MRVTVEFYFFIEILVSMRVVGVGSLMVMVAKPIQSDRGVGRMAPPDTPKHHMTRLPASLVPGLLVADRSGEGFVALASMAPIFLRVGLAARAGHVAVAGSARA